MESAELARGQLSSPTLLPMRLQVNLKNKASVAGVRKESNREPNTLDIHAQDTQRPEIPKT